MKNWESVFELNKLSQDIKNLESEQPEEFPKKIKEIAI